MSASSRDVHPELRDATGARQEANGPHSPQAGHGDPTLLGVPLRHRWASLGPDLRALAHGLEAELAPLTHRPWPVPAMKAQLTRTGGRCRRDGTPLTMNPWLPHTHRCPTCGDEHVGTEHDAWWAMGAQLWCAERVLQAALLGGMQSNTALLALAADGLARLGEAWPTYPNRDNALGPTRPFFSTYLESVWLLTTALAARVLAQLPGHAQAAHRFAREVAEPSAALIRSYPEGRSNRQAWHVAARLAVAELLGDAGEIDTALHARDGLVALLHDGLLPDGAWYEGENYHLFAHRGLWYGVMMAQTLGVPLPDTLVERFDRGFATPLRSLLPDGTFPSRRDARYAVSVHQWRFAEWCELGLARRYDPEVARWLQRLYASKLPRGDTGRARSTAEIERDEPACALQRADLGWRTLLCARPNAWPAPLDAPVPSVVLPQSGLAVLRRDAGRIYVALEGGPTGGGHGHPDRLALTLQDGDHRVLEDPGTGSYVERTLHWYRSTLAHNAPLVNGRSQQRVPTRLRAFESRAAAGWIDAEASGIANGVAMRRRVVLCDDHVVDLLTWHASEVHTVDLPLHAAIEPHVGPSPLHERQRETDAGAGQRGDPALYEADTWRSADARGAGGLEDGFDFLQEVACVELHANPQLAWHGTARPALRAWTHAAGHDASASVSLWRAMAPGPPRTAPRRMHWVRVRAASGYVLTVWSLRGAVVEAHVDATTEPRSELAHDLAAPPVRVRLTNGTEVTHLADGERWRLDLRAGVARSRIVLEGVRERASVASRRAPSDAPPSASSGASGPTAVSLSAAPSAPARAPTDMPSTAPREWPGRGVLVLSPQEQRFTLGAAHYRRSEPSWEEAGCPTCVVALRRHDASLELLVEQSSRPPVVPPEGTDNPFDNERADVNADGVQLYVGRPGEHEWRGAWLVVPDLARGAARRTPLLTERSTPLHAERSTPLHAERGAEVPTLRAHAAAAGNGWRLTVSLPLAWLRTCADRHGDVAFDLIVNERTPDRARRRGQFVLSGAEGEWVYLRGDRHDPARALRLRLPAMAPSHLDVPA